MKCIMKVYLLLRDKGQSAQLRKLVSATSAMAEAAGTRFSPQHEGRGMHKHLPLDRCTNPSPNDFGTSPPYQFDLLRTVAARHL